MKLYDRSRYNQTNYAYNLRPDMEKYEENPHWVVFGADPIIKDTPVIKPTDVSDAEIIAKIVKGVEVYSWEEVLKTLEVYWVNVFPISCRLMELEGQPTLLTHILAQIVSEQTLLTTLFRENSIISWIKVNESRNQAEQFAQNQQQLIEWIYQKLLEKTTTLSYEYFIPMMQSHGIEIQKGFLLQPIPKFDFYTNLDETRYAGINLLMGNNVLTQNFQFLQNDDVREYHAEYQGGIDYKAAYQLTWPNGN